MAIIKAIFPGTEKQKALILPWPAPIIEEMPPSRQKIQTNLRMFPDEHDLEVRRRLATEKSGQNPLPERHGKMGIGKTRPPFLMLGFIVFLQICILGVAGFAMHYIVNKPDLSTVFGVQGTFLDSQESIKIKELEQRITLLEQENKGLKAQKTPKTIVKKIPDYTKYKVQDFKFYMEDGQVFVGRVVQILPKHLIIYNNSTKKQFKVPKKRVVNVLTITQ